MSLLSNPPEKIYLPFGTWHEHTQKRNDDDAEYHLAPTSIELEDFGAVHKTNVICPNCGKEYLMEYGIGISAPQWHDAKTDPPKEDGCYAVTWRGIGEYWERGEWSHGEWWDVVEDKKYNPQPDFYYALPEPPKESENAIRIICEI